MTTGATAENVRSVLAIERQARTALPLGNRLSKQVTRLTGRVSFAIINAVLIGTWVLANLRVLPGLPVVDPFPFSLLTLVLSVEAILLSIFVLMAESEAVRESERRAHLDLQINVLAEQELTAALVMLRALCQHSGITVDMSDQKLSALVQDTRVDQIVSEIDSELDETVSSQAR